MAILASGFTGNTMSISQATATRLKQEAARLTPAKREGFEVGTAAAIQLMAEEGADAVIGENVKRLTTELQHARRQAEQSLDALRGLTPCTENLDERGKHIVSLTASLLATFREQTSVQEYASGRRSPDNNATVQIVRAVSYIVWAYANTTGAPMPDVVAEEPA